MVVVFAAQDVDVKGDAGGGGEGLEDVGDHFGGEVADFLADELEVGDAVGSVAEVDNGAGQGLVERREAVAEALDALDGAEGLLEGGTKSNGAVFSGVMVVD